MAKPTAFPAEFVPGTPARESGGRVVAGILFTAFFFAGGAMTWFFCLAPALKITEARTWPEIPCTIISSDVRVHDDGEGPTYSVDIHFAYEFQGRAHKSDRYCFTKIGSSGYKGKKQIINRYPAGSQTTCFVNPENPDEAVLFRGVPTELYILAPLSLLFFLIGVGGLWGVVSGRSFSAGRTVSASTPDRVSGPVAHRPAPGGRVMFEPKVPPKLKFIGMLIVALFWNGIAWTILLVSIFARNPPRLAWFPDMFILLFVLIGLGLAGGSVYFFLAMFNPRPKLILDSPAVPLGGTLGIEWQMSGRVSAVQTLKIELEGREEATYSVGTSTTTDQNVFARIPVAVASSPAEMVQGSAPIVIPADSMHSFTGKNNKVVWCLKVHGDIAHWPDVNEEFELTVLPVPVAGASPP